jgi:hypothetical protein
MQHSGINFSAKYYHAYNPTGNGPGIYNVSRHGIQYLIRNCSACSHRIEEVGTKTSQPAASIQRLSTSNRVQARLNLTRAVVQQFTRQCRLIKEHLYHPDVFLTSHINPDTNFSFLLTGLH